MKEAPRYSTLGDYLHVLRRRRVLIALITLGFFAVALASSLTQSATYTAQSKLQFRDPLADLSILGPGGDRLPELAAAQRSALNAELLTRPEVTREVIEQLDTTLSASGLLSAVDTRVDPRTNLVVVEATWDDAQFAADVSNAFANAARIVGEQDTLERLQTVEDTLRARLRAEREDLPPPGQPTGDAGLAFRIASLEQSLSNIRSLEEVSEPVQIAERASVPGSPTSPNVARTGILGFAVGLVVALLVAFVRDSLDRRLHSAQDVHDELELPVVGRVGAAAFAYPGLASKQGPAMLENDFEAFRVLRRNIDFLAQNGTPPRTILVTSPVAAEGKSTVSLSLASAAALAGQRVLLLECDLRKPSLARRLNVPREPGLTEYLNGNASPSDILRVVPLSEPRQLEVAAGSQNGGAAAARGKRAPEANVICVTAGGPVANAPELLQSQRFKDMLAKVSRAYDLVIMDGSPLLAVADPLELVPLVDCVLVCVRAQQTTREQVRAVRSALGHLPERPAGAVMTGLRPGDESYGYYYGY